MNKKISVIVPIYKVEGYIEECINSIVNQSYRNLEIILVDDGSPDACGEICDRYAEVDQRIHVIHKENGGISEARNYGIKAATGELIGFVDGDDYIYKYMYERMVNEMLNRHADIVECGIVEFIDGENPNNYGDSNHIFEITSKDCLTEIKKNNFSNSVAANKLYKYSLFNDVEFPVGRNYEDTATTYKLIYNANKVVRLCKEMYFYRQRTESITHSQITLKDIDDKIKAVAERCEFFDEHNELEIANFCRVRYANFIILYYNKWKKASNEVSVGWYLNVRRIFFKIFRDFSVPLKNKMYICAFLICPRGVSYLRGKMHR